MEVHVNVKEEWALIDEMAYNRAFTEEYITLKWWEGKTDKHGNRYTYVIVRAPEMDEKELKKILLQDIKRYKNKIKKQKTQTTKKTRTTVTKKATSKRTTATKTVKKEIKATLGEALDSCGRLKKTYKFTGKGKVVKVVKTKVKR